jgi:hypothetical protein
LLQTAIFIFYLLLSSYIIVKLSFFKHAGLQKQVLVGLFILKIVAGLVFALFYKQPEYYATSDTWRFYHLSLQETQWLLHDPIAFIKDLFSYGYDTPGNIFSGSNSYWNDLKSNVIIKLLAFLNVLTHNSYYANLVICNLIFFVGQIALYRALLTQFPLRKWRAIAGVFLIPSTLFWCSGVHKDGFILAFTGLVIFLFHCKIVGRQRVAVNLLLILFCLAAIFVLRNYVALALAAALLAWALALKFPSKTYRVFFAVYLLGVIAFFVAPLLFPALDFPSLLANKQHEFIALEGGSNIHAQPLQPTVGSYLSYLPVALDMALLRPHLYEVKSPAALLAAVEMLLAILILCLFVLFRYRGDKFSPLELCLLFFGASILLIAGYTIPFSGAIVRYRSFALPFMIIPLLCGIDLKRLVKVKSRNT